MLLTILKSKLHGATITDCEAEYEGSIAIDEGLMKASGIVAGEQVHVLNSNNHSRIITYAIPAKKGSGEIGLRGPAAHYGKPGDSVIILAYCHATPKEAAKFKPKKIFLDYKNKIKKHA
jgi:aspartate 1-decarboxylase